jgi:hypothetical protein
VGVDAESRVKKLKEFFGNRMLSDITRRDVERLQSTLRAKKIARKTPLFVHAFLFICSGLLGPIVL